MHIFNDVSVYPRHDSTGKSSDRCDAEDDQSELPAFDEADDCSDEEARHPLNKTRYLVTHACLQCCHVPETRQQHVIFNQSQLKSSYFYIFSLTRSSWWRGCHSCVCRSNPCADAGLYRRLSDEWRAPVGQLCTPKLSWRSNRRWGFRLRLRWRSLQCGEPRQADQRSSHRRYKKGWIIFLSI